MVTNMSQKLINYNNGIEENTENVSNIKMSAEFRECSYTRNEWDGEVTLEGFKLRVNKKEFDDVTVKYIVNALNNEGIYNKIEIIQDENSIEFEAWIYTEHDWCSSVIQLEKSLYNIREKMKTMLRIFEIYNFELIGLFYYAPTFS